jgi:DNA topoisomerase-3
MAFVPRRFWGLAVAASLGGGPPVPLVWGRPDARTFSQPEAAAALARCQQAMRGGGLRVHAVRERERRHAPPTGLDTVQLLRAASLGMGMSPHRAMEVAERVTLILAPGWLWP